MFPEDEGDQLIDQREEKGTVTFSISLLRPIGGSFRPKIPADCLGDGRKAFTINKLRIRRRCFSPSLSPPGPNGSCWTFVAVNGWGGPGSPRAMRPRPNDWAWGR